MKILWSVNLVPAPAAEKLNIKSDVLGGWVESMAAQLCKNDNISLAVACKCEGNIHFKDMIDNVLYYSLEYAHGGIEALEKRCSEIIEDFKPDLIQIEGTEFLHAKAMLSVGKKKGIPTVVSMQGILNGQYNYQCGQLQVDDMMFSKSLTEMYAGWVLHLRKNLWYKKRMGPEKDIISQADYILGRTTWDRAHSYKLNPNAQYFSVSRVLRAPFYENSWSIDKMERHSIYVGNGYHALKGLHFVIHALPQLIREYPDIKVYVAGVKPFSDDDKRPFYKKGFGAYLQKLIKDNGVSEHIVFTGPLKADEVAKKLTSVNAYVLCSAVENSPNTLGEAMLVGTPCVAAYVGGVSDMATDGEDALFYRNDDSALLAWNIKRVFDSDELALKLSENGKKRAEATHNPERNADNLFSCYKKITGEND